jgi:hypothetical protein
LKYIYICKIGNAKARKEDKKISIVDIPMQLVSSDPSVFLEKCLLEVALFERDSFDFLINKYEVASMVLEQV